MHDSNHFSADLNNLRALTEIYTDSLFVSATIARLRRPLPRVPRQPSTPPPRDILNAAASSTDEVSLPPNQGKRRLIATAKRYPVRDTDFAQRINTRYDAEIDAVETATVQLNTALQNLISAMTAAVDQVEEDSRS